MHLPPNVKRDLEKWLKDHVEEIMRDRMDISAACVRATKAVSCRVHRNNMEDAAIALKFAWPSLKPAEPAQPPPAPATEPEKDEAEEVVQLATEFALLKRRILDQSAKVEDAKRFAEEATQEWRREEGELQELVKEQLRIRTVLKEAMEV